MQQMLIVSEERRGHAAGPKTPISSPQIRKANPSDSNIPNGAWGSDTLPPVELEVGDITEELHLPAGRDSMRRYFLQGEDCISWTCEVAHGYTVDFIAKVSVHRGRSEVSLGGRRLNLVGVDSTRVVMEPTRGTSVSGCLDLAGEHKGCLGALDAPGSAAVLTLVVDNTFSYFTGKDVRLLVTKTNSASRNAAARQPEGTLSKLIAGTSPRVREGLLSPIAESSSSASPVTAAPAASPSALEPAPAERQGECGAHGAAHFSDNFDVGSASVEPVAMPTRATELRQPLLPMGAEAARTPTKPSAAAAAAAPPQPPQFTQPPPSLDRRLSGSMEASGLCPVSSGIPCGQDGTVQLRSLIAEALRLCPPDAEASSLREHLRAAQVRLAEYVARAAEREKDHSWALG